MNHAPRTTHHAPRSAFTLVEMLIAMVLTLILVTAIAQFYAIVGDSVKDGRAMIEVGGQLRAAVQQLRSDLDLITVQAVPWTDDGAASGYLEYFEGPGHDYDANGDGTPDAHTPGSVVPNIVTTGTNTNAIGDGDDFLAFTMRAHSGQSFTGRLTSPLGTSPTMITSQLAEVVWWVGFDDLNGDSTWDLNEPRQIYRRQLLIRPDLTNIDSGATYTTASAAEAQLRRLWQENDISLSVRANMSTGQYFIAPNALSDLTRREYRFAHQPLNLMSVSGVLQDTNFPHRQQLLQSSSPAYQKGATLANSYVLQAPNGNLAEGPGEDIVLSSALAFDVQVYDPYAKIWLDSSNGLAVGPGDPGYQAAATAATSGGTPRLVALGAYVDLFYYRRFGVAPSFVPNTISNLDNTLKNNPNIAYPLPWYADGAEAPSGISLAVYRQILGATYDTWALSYERDGIAQHVTPARHDLSTNGNDDDGQNGVDDAGERETVPPYSQPLRGIQVKIRVYEPTTRQVRQATVATDFVME